MGGVGAGGGEAAPRCVSGASGRESSGGVGSATEKGRDQRVHQVTACGLAAILDCCTIIDTILMSANTTKGSLDVDGWQRSWDSEFRFDSRSIHFEALDRSVKLTYSRASIGESWTLSNRKRPVRSHPNSVTHSITHPLQPILAFYFFSNNTLRSCPRSSPSIFTRLRSSLSGSSLLSRLLAEKPLPATHAHCTSGFLSLSMPS